jgi:hypothetical protein
MLTTFQKNITIVLAAFGLLLFAIACKKEKDPPAPVQDEVTIEIHSPEDNAVLHAGESLHIHVVIKSPVTLHGYSWKLTDKTDGSILAEQDDHTHEKELTIHEHWDWEEHITQQTQATLEVTAIVDHDGKTAKKSVDITFHP